MTKFALADPLPIYPLCKKINTRIHLPGSKSITNRALVLAALACGDTCLDGVLFSRDTEIMLTALEKLGFSIIIDQQQKQIRVHGEAGKIPINNAKINVGNAGTAARFLTAMLCLNPNGCYQLDGDPPMRERPMQGLTEALESLNAATFTFHSKYAHFPFTMHTKGWMGGHCVVDASASSQILSALLLSSPCGTNETRLDCPHVRPSYVEITRSMCAQFGANISLTSDTGHYIVSPTQYIHPETKYFPIEPDLSAASYWFAIILIHGGKISLPLLNKKTMQGDARFVELLSLHGLILDKTDAEWLITSPGLMSLSEVNFDNVDFAHFSDTFLTYATIIPLLGIPMQINGIGHTRLQETDRVSAMARELTRLGQQVKETKDSLRIHPNLEAMRAIALKARNQGSILSIDTYEDHRFAMSFAVLASYDLFGDGKPWLAIRNPSCCNKTYPNFFDTLNDVSAKL